MADPADLGAASAAKASSQLALRDAFLRSPLAADWRWVDEWGWMRRAVHEDGGWKWVRDGLGPQASAQRIVQAADARRHTSGNVDAVVKLAKPHLIRLHEEFNARPSWLNTPAGAVDLRSGGMRTPVDEEFLPTRMTRVAPAEGPCPRFLRFLSQIHPDREIAAWLMRELGYMMTGFTRERSFHFWWGSGANGKSTLLDLLTHILGDYAKNCQADMFMRRGSEQHRARWAHLVGARLVTVEEIPAREAWNEASLKTFSGGSDRITANFMRGNFFEFEPEALLIIPGNARPRFLSAGLAIHDRMRLVEFGQRFEGEAEDKTLRDALKDEAPAILHLLIREAGAWLRSGLLPVPDSVDEASADYIEEADTLAATIDEVLEPSDGSIAGMEIVRALGRHAAQSRQRVDWEPKDVYDVMRRKGYRETKPGNRVRFHGVSVRLEYAPEIEHGPPPAFGDPPF